MIRLKNVQKNYGRFRLDCSLEVKPGCVTGLIGANGAGKSTAFKAILDLIRLDGGSIEVLGKPWNTLSARDKQKIGVVFPGYAFSGCLTVKQLIPVLAGLYEKFDRGRFLSDCERFGLPMGQKTKEFSTGMRAKLKLLSVLSYSPQILILDEPTSGLDVVARDGLLDLLREHMREDRAILISSHISGDLEGFCDDIYMIDEGRIILHEDTDVLMDGYGVLKVSDEELAAMDQQYLLKKKRTSFGWQCLTDHRQYYMDNYPRMVVEKGSIDEVILMMVKEERA